MLQHPSKFHSHPLSHFLALHNSAVAAAANNQHHHHFQSQSHLSHQSQSPLHSNHTASQLASQIHLNGPHPIVGNLDSSTTTSLDVGKSFTIAAILGLQKSAIEQSQKDCGNSAMNLSRSTYHHHHHNSHHQSHSSQKSNFSQNNGNNAGTGGIGAGGNNGSNSNNNNNNSVSGNCGNNGVTNSNGGLNLNIFDCDSVNASVINRYLPSNNINNSNNPNHIRFNHFGHHHQSVVTAAAAVVNSAGGPSALQSLQQLHQQHAQQATLGFQTQNKVKNDLLSSKKSSLKSKRVRTIFTPEQLERLEAEFERQQYMVGPERLYLAHTLQLTEAQVKVWFQNRRIKWRKHHLEITQQRLALIRQRQLPSSDANITSPEVTNQLRQSESDLSVCNDSMDTESVNESDDI